MSRGTTINEWILLFNLRLVYFPEMKSCSLSLSSKRFSISIRGSHVANFGHTECYRHSTLTALERCLVPTETVYGIEMWVKTLRHAANQEVQLTVHHLNPLNKRLCRRWIHPLHIYSIFDKKYPMYFPPVVKTGDHASRVYCERLRLRSVSAWSLLCTLFARGDAHTDVV